MRGLGRKWRGRSHGGGGRKRKKQQLWGAGKEEERERKRGQRSCGEVDEEGRGRKGEEGGEYLQCRCRQRPPTRGNKRKERTRGGAGGRGHINFFFLLISLYLNNLNF